MSHRDWALFIQAHYTFEERNDLRALVRRLTGQGLTR